VIVEICYHFEIILISGEAEMLVSAKDGSDVMPG